MKDQRTSCLGFWEPLELGSVTCVCAYARECVCARNSKSASALARDCHLVGADLGPFRPVGFVVVCKTRVKVNSAFPPRVPQPKALCGSSGMETFRICHACHFCFKPVRVLTLKSFHASRLLLRTMTEVILYTPGLLLY